MNDQKDDAWKEAKRRCRLNDEEIRMAKELGFQPKSLIKNIPASSEQWKAPVKQWVRSLYEKKLGSRKPAASPIAAPPPSVPPKRPRVIEFRNPDHPWPDRPAIPDLRPYDLSEQQTTMTTEHGLTRSASRTTTSLPPAKTLPKKIP